MASEYRRLLEARTLSANQIQRYDEAFDAGAYNSLQVHFRVLRVGTGTGGGKIRLYHAALNEPDAYVFLTAAEAVVDSTGLNVFVSITGFLRYIIWQTDNNVAGNPVVLIDIIAKE